MYAHGGIVAAAAAILQDMEQHKLLQRLLEQYDPFDQQNLQPGQRCMPAGLNVILYCKDTVLFRHSCSEINCKLRAGSTAAR